MSELRITQAPWHVGEDDHLREVVSAEGVVCQLYEYGEIKPAKRMANSEANARLIAAAPELLEVCRELLGHCERYLGPTICGGEMTKARAAIKKATS